MKMKLGKAILLGILAIITITSLYALLDEGRNYIGKNYFESDSFQMELSQYEMAIVPLMLVTLDPEELKKDITVTPSEIEEHRYRYGGLENQLESIRSQYEGVTEQALIEERDKKLEDITRNFQDDKYVEDKILAEKEKEIDAYLKSLKQAKRDFQNKYQFVYELENVETGEKFTSGGLDSKLAFKKVYSSKNGYLKESPIYYNIENSIDSLPEETFKGTIAITKDTILNGSNAYEYSNFVTNQWIFYGLLIGGVIAGFLFVSLYRANREIFDYKPGREKFSRLPIDVRMALILIAALIAVGFTKDFIRSVFNLYGGWYDISIASFLLAAVIATATLYMCEWLIRDYKWNDWETSWIVGAVTALKGFFLIRSLSVQVLILLVVIFFWGLGTLLLFMVPEAVIVWLGASVFIGFPTLFIILSKTSYLNRVIQKSEELVNGNGGTEIEVKGNSAIARLAANLNQLRGRVQSSQTEQVKSERLKTELITNVSHDLRTPLTSIITYTDLLKNPNITEEERASYIEILDKKSMRLKTLIEDLFEVSKMASGNIELEKRKVDLTQLLTQAIAEHQEDIDKQGLDFRVTIGTKPIMAYVDGQKWWRMLDNLIINTLKYAMPNTRVYINLDQDEKEAVFVMKNIANYELGSDDAAELTERFKRADTSRHTDGSGLGLAIAQSIVDLHGGILKIEVDGDLFKVTVRVQAV